LETTLTQYNLISSNNCYKTLLKLKKTNEKQNAVLISLPITTLGQKTR